MSIRKRTWTNKSGPQEARICDYSDAKGKRHIKTFALKRDANAWAAQTNVEIGEGRHTADSASITVAEAAENWIRRAESEGLEPATIERYREVAERKINKRLGTEKLSRLTAPAIERFRDRLLENETRLTAKRTLAHLKSILKEAMKRGDLAQSAAAGVSICNGKCHQRRVEVGREIHTPAEVQAIIEHPKGRWRPLIITAAMTGLRASETRGLAWSTVDFDAKEFRVEQRADKFGEIGSPKSHAGQRTVPMPPPVLNALRHWKLECPASKQDLVFPNGAGNIEPHANVRKRGLIAAGQY